MPIDDFFKNDSAKTNSSSIISLTIETFKSNLEIVPDIFLVTVGIFALLLQSPSFTALTGSLLSINLIQPFIARYLREIIPNTWGVQTRATGMFPGTSVERMSLGNNSPIASLPSYYTMFIGTLLGWFGPMYYYYQPELQISPQRTLGAIISGAFLALFSLILLFYRYFSSQDTLYGIFLGVGFGAVFGIVVMTAIYFTTQRRATNLYNFPLLSTSYGGSKQPIYVCESSSIPAKSSS